MRGMYRVCCLLLALILCVGCSAPPSESATPSKPVMESAEPLTWVPREGFAPGMRIPDLTVTTCDGKAVSLHQALEGKELLVLNLWASWCGPCGMEFPFLQEAYTQLSDQIEVIALSTEPTDTDDVLRAYAEEKGLTFPVAQDVHGLGSAFGVAAIPTTVLVDRFGVICLQHSGAQPSVEAFKTMFAPFLGEDYTESAIFRTMPAGKASGVSSDPEALNKALNGESSLLTFACSSNPYVYPMAAAEKDGRTVAASTNGGKPNSHAEIGTTVSVRAGDAAAITFCLDAEAASDWLVLRVNGEPVKRFTGVRDWQTEVYPFAEDGVYHLSLSYYKNGSGDAEGDGVWIDTIEVLSGEAAEAALAAVSTRPVSDSVSLFMEGVQEILFSDPDGMMFNPDYFSRMRFFVGTGAPVTLTAELTEDLDPAQTVLVFDNGAQLALADCLQTNGYRLTMDAASLTPEGYPFSSILLADLRTGETLGLVLYFPAEADVEQLVSLVTDRQADARFSWEKAPALPSQVSYEVWYADQNGDPVEGVVLQVCNDAMCMVYTSDANGLCSFTLEPFAYELHTLVVPEGYAAEPVAVTAPRNGGSITIPLTKS